MQRVKLRQLELGPSPTKWFSSYKDGQLSEHTHAAFLMLSFIKFHTLGDFLKMFLPYNSSRNDDNPPPADKLVPFYTSWLCIIK